MEDVTKACEASVEHTILEVVASLSDETTDVAQLCELSSRHQVEHALEVVRDARDAEAAAAATTTPAGR